MHVRVIGGLLIQDVSVGIIAVIKDDAMFKNIRDANELPDKLINRLADEIITEKLIIILKNSKAKMINQVYGLEHAVKVLEASILYFSQ